MVNDCKNSYRAGIDIGSTTAKMVICNNSGKPAFSRYRRHNAMTLDTVLSILKEARDQMGNIQLDLAVTGSAGMGVAESFGLPFVQEVVASAKLIKTSYPEVRTLIEIGGEDSKVVFFEDHFRPDIRMNGSCAGGTGAFIDQMAVLLDVSLPDFDRLAGNSTSIHPIASRCGVFAKTDIQALLSNKVSREDIAASVFHAVALQVITTLARGHEIRKQILFAGGPLKFFPQLQKAFIDVLKLNREEDLVMSDYPEFIPAIGVALNHNDQSYKIEIQKLIQLMGKGETRVPQASEINRLSPLFSDSEEFQVWEKRHAQQIVKKIDIARIDGKLCFLGIDSGSTTAKIVLIDDEGSVALTYYAPNNGDSIQAVREGLKKFQAEFKRAGITPRIVRTATTGYGEDLIRAAFDMDDGVVETMAHYRAAKSFDKNVSFILDIGGQDMKAIYINDGVVSDIQVNEACSSGCGSFIETFARSLGYDVSEFAGLACQKNAPFDLGSRCTVFMNSRVKQALREGATVSDISAGLAYSVIKNSLYKVLKLKDSDTLGKQIVAQGGTFRNPAVLRAFEILLGREVICPDISELMGAYGAALTALQNYRADLYENPPIPTLPKGGNGGFILSGQEDVVSRKAFHCKGCENRCSVKRLIFNNGKSYFTGNRCERYFSNGASSKKHGGNLIAAKFKLLFDRKMEPDRSPILTFGIPRVLNMYENFPFWCTFFVECGFKVVLSDPSSVKLFELGAGTIMSDNICFPAKLAHGHIIDLIEKGVDRIFYPTVVYESREYRDALNSFNCPIVTGYSDVIKSSVDPEGKHGIPVDNPVISFKDSTLLKKQLYSFARQFGISKNLVCQAMDKGITAHREYKNQLKGMAIDIIDNAGINNRPVVVLAGRPYHIDPLINHGIPELLAGMGVDIIPEDAVPIAEECALKDSNILTQWSYTNRLLAAAKYVADTEHTELVQITSFGCGLDAISADEAREIIKDAGKFYTLIKMDEIANLGAVKIRLRSMLEAIKEVKGKRQKTEDKKKKTNRVFMPKDRERTIIVPWFSHLYSSPMPAVSKTLGHRLEVLPPPDRSSVDVGLKYVNNDMCYPAVIVIGDIIKALQSGKYDPKQTAVMLTETGGQCRASNYLSLTRKALISTGFSDVPVLSLSMDDTNLQPGFTIDRRGLIRRLGMGLIFTDALARMYLATAAREMDTGESETIHKKYLFQMEKGIEEANFKYLLNLLKEAVSEFNAINIKNESVPTIGVLGEIFVKYNSFSNNNIVEWLIGQGVEVVLPSLSGFFMQRFVNEEFDQSAYLKRSLADRLLTRALDKYTRYYLSRAERIMQNFRYYRKTHDLKELAEAASKATSLANQAGEGWLLPAEMISMLKDGTGNIICLQPFGCLANHITGNGLERRLKTLYPQLNLLSLNMDAGTSEVNILNRLHFIVMAAKEEMKDKPKAINHSVNRPPLAESCFLTRPPAILKEYMLLEVGKWKSWVLDRI